MANTYLVIPATSLGKPPQMVEAANETAAVSVYSSIQGSVNDPTQYAVELVEKGTSAEDTSPADSSGDATEDNA